MVLYSRKRHSSLLLKDNYGLVDMASAAVGVGYVAGLVCGGVCGLREGHKMVEPKVPLVVYRSKIMSCGTAQAEITGRQFAWIAGTVAVASICLSKTMPYIGRAVLSTVSSLPLIKMKVEGMAMHLLETTSRLDNQNSE
jgi:hypothetical protein